MWRGIYLFLLGWHSFGWGLITFGLVALHLHVFVIFARVLFIVGLVGLHSASVLFSCLRGCLTFSLTFLIMARVLFTFGVAGSHVTRVLSIVGMNALHSAWVLFNV